MSLSNEKSKPSLKSSEIADAISSDRIRTNLLRKQEQKAIVFLVQRIPSWISSNMLTAIGFFGNVIVFVSFILAAYFHRFYLLLGILGFLISWFGDSLDGRIAYFRKKSRKWYGLIVDISFDWAGIILIGLGYVLYTEGIGQLLGYVFVVMYGWGMIIALMRFKITGEYSIDSGLLGPTEARIIISAILLAEVLIKGSILYTVAAICVVLLIADIVNTHKLSKAADELDRKEKDGKLHGRNT
jgi:phosphatidylglycerophosphate synthase